MIARQVKLCTFWKLDKGLFLPIQHGQNVHIILSQYILYHSIIWLQYDQNYTGTETLQSLCYDGYEVAWRPGRDVDHVIKIKWFLEKLCESLKKITNQETGQVWPDLKTKMSSENVLKRVWSFMCFCDKMVLFFYKKNITKLVFLDQHLGQISLCFLITWSKI